MGKKKHAQRTKNNVVPASSGRSAELLQSSSGVPFVGFSALKEGGFIPIISGISDELDLNINEDFRLCWKKMNKKDITTKLKALDEFRRLCFDSEVEALKPVLPYWPRLFTALSTDEEHHVREAAHAAHRVLVSKAGRNIAPYLKQLVGPWFTGQHDTYPPAASTAEASFQETFPPNKQVEAIVFCQEEILNYISHNLLTQTPQTLANNQTCSQEVKDARYQRVVVSCLNGYALYLQRLPPEHLRSAHHANHTLVSSAKFWKFYKDSASIVRAAWFTALVALCERAPWLLAEESKHVCLSVFSSLDDSDPSVVLAVWLAALLTFTVVEDVWKYVSLEKMVLPKLWKVLRLGADGNASLVFPNLLPFLSKVAPSLLQQKANFYSKFFENLRSGLMVRNVQISGKESSAVISSFLECLRYVVNVNSDQPDLCLSLFEDHVFPLLREVISDVKLQQARTCLFSGVASLMNHYAKQSDPLYHSLCTKFWGKLSLSCQRLLQDHVIDYSALSTHCTAVQALLMALKNPDSQPRKSFKVKFVSPRKSQEEEAEDEPKVPEEQASLAQLFEEARMKFVESQLTLCLGLVENCGVRAAVVLVSHLAQILQEYHSPSVLQHVLLSSRLSWPQFYRQRLAPWLRDKNIPLDYSLRVIFTLLEYVQDEDHLKIVYSDLSGEETLSVSVEEGEFQLEPLCVRWQAVLEWALRPEHHSAAVRRWVSACGDVCRLATIISRQDPSYNILLCCLRNLRHNSWLSEDALAQLLTSLLNNLTDSSVSVEGKTCSADLLHAVLQNTANHAVLAQLPEEHLRTLFYQLFTASLQQLPHFPPCWQQCLAVLLLQTDSELALSAICETSIDLMLAVTQTRGMNLAESQQLVNVVQELIQVAGLGPQVVLSHLSAVLMRQAEAVWHLYSLTLTVSGLVTDFPLYCPQFTSTLPKDPLACFSLQEYVTSMIPFMVMVVRMQTASQPTDDSTDQCLFARLKAEVPPEDLWDWSLQVLQLQSICVFIKTHFSSTKQYFLLKDKVTFILEECGLFSQLRVKDIIKHLKLGLFEEGTKSFLDCDPLSKLQKEVVLRDLSIFYNVHQIQKDLLPFKTKNTVIKRNFFPEEVLDELSACDTLNRDLLPLINICHSRLGVLHLSDSYSAYISLLDKVFDQFVADQKENRSLLHLPAAELLHIAAVTQFATNSVMRDSAHLTQSSWDACMVATAALSLSVSCTLTEWQSDRGTSANATATATPITPPPAKPWPLSLLTAVNNLTDYQEEELLSLSLVHVMCSVCHLFDAVSRHMATVKSEDKAAVIRRTEWNEVFLHGTHAAISQAWLTVAGLPCDRPSIVLLLDALSSSVAQYVEYPHFLSGDDTLASLDVCCRLLQAPETSVQLAAYHLLIKLIPAMVELDMKECEMDNVALSCQHVDNTLIYTQSIIDAMLSGLSFGDSCVVEPFTDSYSYTRCYLLLWCALLELCAHACSQLRALYTTWLKEAYLPVFMKTVFCLMPEAALHGDVTSSRIAQHFSKATHLDTGLWDSERLAQLSCRVYASALRCLPAAMRQWWTEADHRVSCLVEHVTATYVSPDLCADEMRAIQSHDKKFDNMTVHVMSTAKEVYAVYTVEESRMELVIELAHNHPLGLVKVRSGQRMVSTTQTRQWLLQITIFLTHQNGSIWDALELWKTSLDKRFEGVEECYICFAILHSVSHQLPKLSCQTCRKKFHSHCLYKWFTTSNKSTCPICRNLF